MKKLLIAALLAMAGGAVAGAQTEFRHITSNEALSAAKKEGKLVFVDFYTTWCGPCKKMASQVFPQPEVGKYMNETFVPLKLDAENEAPDLAKRYGVRAYPTYVILNPSGKEVAKFSGSMDGSAFIEKCKSLLDPERAPERLRARYAKGERTPELVNAYTMLLMEDRKEDEGFKTIDEYFNSLTDAQRLDPANAFIYVHYTVDMDNPRALFMRDNLGRFPEATRADIKQRLAALYHDEVSKYFSGYMYREGKYDPAQWNALKTQLNDLGFNEGGAYDTIIEFVENRPAMDDAAYLDFCDKNYDRLSQQGQTSLALNISRLVKPSTPELKAGISRFLRARLSTMTPTCLSVAARTLASIER